MADLKQEIISKVPTHHPANLLCTPQFHQKLQTDPSVLFGLCQVWFYPDKSRDVLPVDKEQPGRHIFNKCVIEMNLYIHACKYTHRDVQRMHNYRNNLLWKTYCILQVREIVLSWKASKVFKRHHICQVVSSWKGSSRAVTVLLYTDRCFPLYPAAPSSLSPFLPLPLQDCKLFQTRSSLSLAMYTILIKTHLSCRVA